MHVYKTSFMHPLLLVPYLTHLLVSYSEFGDSENELIARMTLSTEEGGLSCHIIGAMGVTPSVDSGIEPFIIYATHSFGTSDKSTQTRFDCIQTLFEQHGDIADQPPVGIFDIEPSKPFSQVSHTPYVFCTAYVLPYVPLLPPYVPLCYLMFFT